jgi:NAD(P)-dependent dehydrogenase (short-subunit alcohol dehydrogenase family)
MSLKDKIAVVTGGSRGLGLGLVEALVAHGAKVTVVARESDALASVRARLGVVTIPADVTARPPRTTSLPRSTRTSWR